MMKSVYLNLFVSSILLCCIYAVFFVSENMYSSSHIYEYYAYFTIGEYIIYILWYYCKMGRIISYINMFFYLLFIFHAGQVILMGIIELPASTRIVMEFYGAKNLIVGYPFINTSLVCFLLGGIWIIKRDKRNKNVDNKLKERKLQLLVEKGKLIFYLFFPFKVCSDIYLIYVNLVYGFVAKIMAQNELPGVLMDIRNMSFIGFLVWFIGTNDEGRRGKLCLYAVLYCLFAMLSSRRIEHVFFLVLLFIIYFKDKKIKKIIFFLYGILGFIIVGFLKVVTGLRDTNSISDSFGNVMDNQNILIEFFREPGLTGYTALTVIIDCLNGRAASMGESFYYALTLLLPNIDGWLTEYYIHANYGLMLSLYSNSLSSSYTNIGGSIIGESFYNWGIIGGVSASFLYGMLLGVLENKLNIFLLKKDYSVVYVIVILFSILFWIRGYVTDIVRLIVYGSMFVWMIKKITIHNIKANK